MQNNEIIKRLSILKRELREAQSRLPAHSVKPGIMHEIFDLEDEIYRLEKLLEIKITG